MLLCTEEIDYKVAASDQELLYFIYDSVSKRWLNEFTTLQFSQKIFSFSATCNDLDSEGTVVTLSWFDFISVFMLRNFWRIMRESKLKFSFYSHLCSKSWLFQSSINCEQFCDLNIMVGGSLLIFRFSDLCTM